MAGLSQNGDEFLLGEEHPVSSDGYQAFVRQLFFTPPEHLAHAVKLSQLPQDTKLEVAFAGRSNVGKSSLINALYNRNAVARVSKEPGRTQALHLYSLGKLTQTERGAARLVDMPGYGFAKAPQQLSHVWGALIGDYLKGRVNLRRVYLLIDARHGIGKLDIIALEILASAAVSTRIVLTKTDKLSPPQIKARLDDTLGQIKPFACALPEIYGVSALNKDGLSQIREDIAGLILPPPCLK